jgi:phosphatidylglycerol:prolipoprotein diacylglycerol transferase
MHPHIVFESLSYLVAAVAYLRLRSKFADILAGLLRWAIVACGVAGAAFGAKALFWFEDPRLTLQNLNNPAYLLGGKTIVGALVGGWVAVEVAKRYIGIHQSTGDLFAIPLALGIAVGRIGCFLTGLSDNTYGLPTSLPWGVDFGDGVRRHPTQLYECVFLLALVPVLYGVMRRISAGSTWFQPGDAFGILMVAYLSFRLLCDSIKPYVHVALGLCSIQWVCIAMLLYYAADARLLGIFRRYGSPKNTGNLQESFEDDNEIARE